MVAAFPPAFHPSTICPRNRGELLWAGSESDTPRTAVVARQPFRIAGAAGEFELRRIPLEVLPVVVHLVHQVAADGRAAAHLFAGDGLLARGHAVQEIGEVVLADVQLDLRILQKSLLRLLHLCGTGGAFAPFLIAVEKGGDHLAAAFERELAAVDLDFAFGAIEVHADAVLVFDHHPVGVDQGRAAVGAGLGRRQRFHGPARIHAQAPLGDVQMVGAPVAYHAAAEFLVVTPVREVLVHPARAEDGIVRPHRRGADPHVPVQSRFHRFLRQIAGDARAAEAALDALDLADDAVLHQFAGDAELLVRPLHRAGLQHALVGVHRLDDLDRLVNVVGQRLLAVDVLARPQGGQRNESRASDPAWRCRRRRCPCD